MKKIAIIAQNKYLIEAFHYLGTASENIEVLIKNDYNDSHSDLPPDIDFVFIDVNSFIEPAIQKTIEIKSYNKNITIFAICDKYDKFIENKFISAGVEKMIEKNIINAEIINKLVNKSY